MVHLSPWDLSCSITSSACSLWVTFTEHTPRWSTSNVFTAASIGCIPRMFVKQSITCSNVFTSSLCTNTVHFESGVCEVLSSGLSSWLFSFIYAIFFLFIASRRSAVDMVAGSCPFGSSTVRHPPDTFESSLAMHSNIRLFKAASCSTMNII